MISYRALSVSLMCLPLLAACTGMLGLGTTPARGGSSTAARNGQQSSRVSEGKQQVRTAAAALVEGIRLYDNGDYPGAIAKLNEPEIQAAPSDIRVEALKYTAFSYCVTENYAKCRDAFDVAFGIDADFKLSASERGHPMWGPVFEQARAASQQDQARSSRGRESDRWRSADAWRAR